MKGFTPAAYTPRLFQHLPATAHSSGSPRLPHPHLIMLNALDGDNASHNGRLGTSKRSDPDPDRALRAKAAQYPQPEEMELDVLHARTHAGG